MLPVKELMAAGAIRLPFPISRSGHLCPRPPRCWRGNSAIVSDCLSGPPVSEVLPVFDVILGWATFLAGYRLAPDSRLFLPWAFVGLLLVPRMGFIFLLFFLQRCLAKLRKGGMRVGFIGKGRLT